MQIIIIKKSHSVISKCICIYISQYLWLVWRYTNACEICFIFTFVLFVMLRLDSAIQGKPLRLVISSGYCPLTCSWCWVKNHLVSRSRSIIIYVNYVLNHASHSKFENMSASGYRKLLLSSTKALIKTHFLVLIHNHLFSSLPRWPLVHGSEEAFFSAHPVAGLDQPPLEVVLRCPETSQSG